MYVVRLKSIDSAFNFGSFTSRPLALSSVESGQNQVIDENLYEAAIFDIASANDPRTAIRLVRDGRAALSGIFPRPMTEAQAAAWLADLYL
jgi:hypothetical protein